MNKLDIFTVGVVILCVLAILFLLWRATDLFKSDKPATDATEQVDNYDRADDRVRNADANFDGEADTDDLNSDGQGALSNVVDGVKNTAGNVADGVDRAAGNVADALDISDEDDRRSTRDGVRDAGDLKVPDSYSNRAGQFMVIAGSFGVEGNANRHRDNLKKQGYSQAEVGFTNGGRYAVVLVDRFVRYSDAKAVEAKLRNEGTEAFVMRQRSRSR